MRRVHWDLQLSPFSSVIERMILLLKEDDVSQDKMHVEQALDTLYSELGMEEEDVFYFCPHGEEALYAIFSSHRALTKEKKHCIIALEETSFLQPLIERLTALGLEITQIPPEMVSVSSIQKLIRPETGLVSFSSVNSLTGEIYPIDELSKSCHVQGLKVHVDGSYMLGILPFCFAEHSIDFLSFDGATLCGPRSSGGFVVKRGVAFHPLFSSSSLRSGFLIEGLARTFLENARHFDHYHLEVARLKNTFEQKLVDQIAGTLLLLKDKPRLPNYSLVQFQGVCSEALYYLLRRKGVHALLVREAIAFALRFDVTEEEIDHVLKVLISTVSQLKSYTYPLITQAMVPEPSIFEKYSKKFHHRIEKPLHAGCFTQEEAEERKMRLAVGKGEGFEGAVQFHWLVDESDGVIVDVKFHVFGSSLLIGLCDLVSELLVRKNYEQALHLSQHEVIRKLECKDGALDEDEISPYYTLILRAIQEASSQCLDIPFLELSLPETAFQTEATYPEWGSLSKERQLAILDEVIEVEIQPYIALDAGGVKILDLIEGREVIIAYEGTCTSCYSATGATLEAIERTLRAKVHPALSVTPDASLLKL